VVVASVPAGAVVDAAVEAVVGAVVVVDDVEVPQPAKIPAHNTTAAKRAKYLFIIISVLLSECVKIKLLFKKIYIKKFILSTVFLYQSCNIKIFVENIFYLCENKF